MTDSMVETIDLNDKKSLIKKQACFSQLTDKEIEELAELFIGKRVSPQEVIVKEGEPVDSVYLIVSGKADVRHVFLKDNQLQNQSLATLGPEEAIGLNEAGFYSLSGVRTATVVALSEMVLLRLSVAAFHGFALTHSHVNEVMHNLAKNMNI